MPSKKKDDVVIQPNKLTLEPFKKLKFINPLPSKEIKKEK